MIAGGQERDGCKGQGDHVVVSDNGLFQLLAKVLDLREELEAEVDIPVES